MITYMFDGAGPRQPGGPSGWGWVAYAGREEVTTGFGGLPHPATNNVAEYTGLIRALQHCLSFGLWDSTDTFEFMGDSALVVRQTLGEWSVKALHLVELRDEAAHLLQATKAELSWLPRDHNGRADMLAAQGRDNLDGLPREKRFTRR